MYKIQKYTVRCSLEEAMKEMGWKKFELPTRGGLRVVSILGVIRAPLETRFKAVQDSESSQGPRSDFERVKVV